MSFPFVALSILASGQADRAALKPFDFMGYVAGTVVGPDMLKGCGKGADQQCVKPMVKVADVYASYLVSLHDQRVSSVYIDAHPNSYENLLRAFTVKYGEPCRKIDAVWANAAGAKLENPMLVWCFSTGELSFSRYGARIDKMGIFYQDNSAPPPAPPTINF